MVAVMDVGVLSVLLRVGPRVRESQQQQVFAHSAAPSGDLAPGSGMKCTRLFINTIQVCSLRARLYG